MSYAAAVEQTRVGVIGGSGLRKIDGLEIVHRQLGRTRWGEPSGPVVFGKLGSTHTAFLPRHGPGHTIAPHQVNYRANIQALSDFGIDHIVAVTAVGGIRSDLGSGALVLPDNLIDYTWGREQTFFAGQQYGTPVRHVDFTNPYSDAIREVLTESAAALEIPLATRAVYAATQGPRFESAAEVDRIERDGGDIVGMTGMPEAGLARELGIGYANISVVVNPAAGRAPDGEDISVDAIYQELERGMARVRQILEHALPGVAQLPRDPRHDITAV